jgi:hypothetical protein
MTTSVYKNTLLSIFTLALLMMSCKKDLEVGINPYDGGKEPSGIKFTSLRADPQEAAPGEVVRINIKGLKQYEGKFTFYVSGVQSQIESLTDSTIDIIVPENVSSGLASVAHDGQYYTGPRIGILGKTTVDVDYKTANGFNSAVIQILEHQGGHIFVGAFTDFNNQSNKGIYRSGIHYLNSLGENDNRMDFRRRANGVITSIVRLPDGKFFVAGSISEFSKRSVQGIARLNENGSLDTSYVDVINPDPEKKPLNGKDTVSSFNGGLNGLVSYMFATSNNSIIAVGSFSAHRKIDYRYSSRDNRSYIYTTVQSVAKLKPDGTLDSSFNRDNLGINGFISGAIQLSDGRIVITGKFSKYNTRDVKNIVCLTPDGKIDETFMSNTGTDDEITSITYNKTTKAIALSGTFKKYGEVNSSGVVHIDESGVLKTDFKFGNTGAYAPNFAYVLTNGRTVVTGPFIEYNGVRRTGILILEKDGSVKQEYNNTGGFYGSVYNLVETKSSLGHPAILLGGYIFSIDDKTVGNVVRIELRD